MLGLLSKRILGAASQEVRSPAPLLQVLSRFCHQRPRNWNVGSFPTISTPTANNNLLSCHSASAFSSVAAKNHLEEVLSGDTVFKGFDFNENDLLSEESLWDLYDRWIKYYGFSRSPDEKDKRFNLFRAKAMFVRNTNKKDLPFKLGLNMFTDKGDDETYIDFLGVSKGFDFNKKDLSSEEFLWDLFERWIRYNGFPRSHYKTYKQFHLRKAETKNLPSKLRLKKFAYKADDRPHIDFLGVFKGFLFYKKDLSSEESLWNLYKRWMGYYGISRNLHEESMRFNLFVSRARFVHNAKKNNSRFKLGLNMFADKGEDESYVDFLRVSKSIDFDKTDLLLEESLWDLYEGWIRYYGFSRNFDEEFKHSYLSEVKAMLPHITNKNDLPFKLRLKFTDKADDESYIDFLGVFKGFDFNEKDLSSEESLWDLYERWISYYGFSRSLDEKYERFNLFRIKAILVDTANKKDLPFKVGLNMFADKGNDETFIDFLRVSKGCNFSKKVFEGSNFSKKYLSWMESFWDLYETWLFCYGFCRCLDGKYK